MARAESWQGPEGMMRHVTTDGRTFRKLIPHRSHGKLKLQPTGTQTARDYAALKAAVKAGKIEIY
jgi:hypothetical protein